MSATDASEKVFDELSELLESCFRAISETDIDNLREYLQATENVSDLCELRDASPKELLAVVHSTLRRRIAREKPKTVEFICMTLNTYPFLEKCFLQHNLVNYIAEKLSPRDLIAGLYDNPDQLFETRENAVSHGPPQHAEPTEPVDPIERAKVSEPAEPNLNSPGQQQQQEQQDDLSSGDQSESESSLTSESDFESESESSNSKSRNHMPLIQDLFLDLCDQLIQGFTEVVTGNGTIADQCHYAPD